MHPLIVLGIVLLAIWIAGVVFRRGSLSGMERWLHVPLLLGLLTIILGVIAVIRDR